LINEKIAEITGEVTLQENIINDAQDAFNKIAEQTIAIQDKRAIEEAEQEKQR